MASREKVKGAPRRAPCPADVEGTVRLARQPPVESMYRSAWCRREPRGCINSGPPWLSPRPRQMLHSRQRMRVHLSTPWSWAPPRCAH